MHPHCGATDERHYQQTHEPVGDRVHHCEGQRLSKGDAHGEQADTEAVSQRAGTGHQPAENQVVFGEERVARSHPQGQLGDIGRMLVEPAHERMVPELAGRRHQVSIEKRLVFEKRPRQLFDIRILDLVDQRLDPAMPMLFRLARMRQDVFDHPLIVGGQPKLIHLELQLVVVLADYAPDFHHHTFAELGQPELVRLPPDSRNPPRMVAQFQPKKLAPGILPDIGRADREKALDEVVLHKISNSLLLHAG